MFIIRSLSTLEIVDDFLMDFHHEQKIGIKWEKDNDKWIMAETDILREWDAEKRKWIPVYLREQINRGGFVLGAFQGNRLAGFCSIDGVLHEAGLSAPTQGSGGDMPFYKADRKYRYANLTMLFVDDEMKRNGIGKALFQGIKKCARALQADKLFISAIPAVDTIAFYFKMGCSDAEEIILPFVDTEEDRYLEYLLTE